MNNAGLARLPFLQGAPTTTIGAVRRVLRPLAIPAGTVLFRTGDEGDACYLVDAGALRVTTSPTGDVLATLGPGSFVGEIALLLGEPRTATVTAVTDAKLLELKRRDLEALMADYPDLALAMTRELGRTLLQHNRRLTGDFGARRSVVWPASMIGRVVGAIDLATRRVGVAALKGASIGATPPGASRVRSPRFGANETHLGAVLLGAPDQGNAAAMLAVADAEHVLVFGQPPQWLVDGAPTGRLVRLSDNDTGVRRAARWATGRAIGLALSSGGSKTVAHIGVLRVLKDANIEIDAVSGSSGGAIAAAAVAFNRDEEFMRLCVTEIAKATHWRRLDFNFPPRSALFKGNKLRALFEKWGDGVDLEDAQIPVWLVAADVATGGEVVMHTGSLADAMRSSMSVPGAFDPWRRGAQLLIDGAVVNPLPVDLLRDAGLGVILASNVAGQATELVIGKRLPGFMSIMGRMLNAMEREVISSLIPIADLVIRPVVAAGSTFDFSGADAMIDAGVEAARERLADIAAVLHAAGIATKVPG
jgi:predicted acylesterase/phospholipase RssA/CRP-like cAMP-binding protein